MATQTMDWIPFFIQHFQLNQQFRKVHNFISSRFFYQYKIFYAWIHFVVQRKMVVTLWKKCPFIFQCWILFSNLTSHKLSDFLFGCRSNKFDLKPRNSLWVTHTKCYTNKNNNWRIVCEFVVRIFSAQKMHDLRSKRLKITTE